MLAFALALGGVTRAAAVVLAGAVGLCACTTVEDVKAGALADAHKHCAAEGKQFVQGAVDVHKAETVFDTDQVTVQGYCVGPGDPGYVPPAR